ncbi:hypothetical protein ACFHYS_19155 [Halalkalibacter oceani]|uniref:hypothetical protein n=1 Tax=Halalkalibacter oceani TaxID=1653776 RepID=UPI003392EB36
MLKIVTEVESQLICMSEMSNHALTQLLFVNPKKYPERYLSKRKKAAEKVKIVLFQQLFDGCILLLPCPFHFYDWQPPSK